MSETLNKTPTQEQSPARVDMPEGLKSYVKEVTGVDSVSSIALAYEEDQQSQALGIQEIMSGISAKKAAVERNQLFDGLNVVTFDAVNEDGTKGWITTLAGSGKSEAAIDTANQTLLRSTNEILESVGSPLRV